MRDAGAVGGRGESNSALRWWLDGRARTFSLRGGTVGAARNVEHAFGAGPWALTGTIALVQDHLANAQS